MNENEIKRNANSKESGSEEPGPGTRDAEMKERVAQRLAEIKKSAAGKAPPAAVDTKTDVPSGAEEGPADAGEAADEMQPEPSGLYGDTIAGAVPEVGEAAGDAPGDFPAENADGVFYDDYPEQSGESDESDESDRQKRVKILLWSASGVCGVVIVGLIFWMIFGGRGAGTGDGDAFKPIEERVFTASDVFGSELGPNIPEGLDFPEGIQKKYKNLYAADKNFVGWLRIPNTAIDTPVYQNKQDSGNDYYIKRDLWSGKWSRYGTNYMHSGNDILNMSRNTVIFGHNFDDDQDDVYDDLIFGEMEQYRQLEFYKENPVIEFNTLYKDYKWKVIACFLTNGSKAGDNGYVFYYISPDMTDDNFMEFIDEIEQRSFIHTGVDVLASDKILTLSTCTYYFDRGGALQDARSVVIARMVREGESEYVDASKATLNENVRFPQLYYNVFGGTNPYRNADKWYPVG